MDQIAVENTSW